MLCWSTEHVKILSDIIQFVAINVMDDLPRLRTGNLAVLPSSPVSPRSVTQPKASNLLAGCMRVGLFGGSCRWDCMRNVRCRADHLVSTTEVFARWKSSELLFIGEQRVTVIAPHLVVAPTHFPRDSRSLAMLTSATNDFPAPSVLRSSMLLQSLVVHEAKAVCCVFATTSIHIANAIFHLGRQLFVSAWVACPIVRYKMLGNSFTVTVIRWIGRKIEAAHACAEQQREAA